MIEEAIMSFVTIEVLRVIIVKGDSENGQCSALTITMRRCSRAVMNACGDDMSGAADEKLFCEASTFKLSVAILKQR